jgi:hypothetical protein
MREIKFRAKRIDNGEWIEGFYAKSEEYDSIIFTNVDEHQGEYFEYEEIDDLIKEKIASKNVCIGARSEDETSTDGSVECSVVMKDQVFGLLPIFDIMNASLDENCTTLSDRVCTNFNYLMPDNTIYWTATPSTENTYSGYRVSTSSNTPFLLSKTSTSAPLKRVYFLSNRLIYVSGTGTKKDPYVVK